MNDQDRITALEKQMQNALENQQLLLKGLADLNDIARNLKDGISSLQSRVAYIERHGRGGGV